MGRINFNLWGLHFKMFHTFWFSFFLLCNPAICCTFRQWWHPSAGTFYIICCFAFSWGLQLEAELLKPSHAAGTHSAPACWLSCHQPCSSKRFSSKIRHSSNFKKKKKKVFHFIYTKFIVLTMGAELDDYSWPEGGGQNENFFLFVHSSSKSNRWA